MDDHKRPEPQQDTAEKDRRDGNRAEEGPRGEKKDDDLDGLGQTGTAEPQPGIAGDQGGGIEDAIGGGTSGQGGG